MEELTVLILFWFREAIAQQHELATRSSPVSPPEEEVNAKRTEKAQKPEEGSGAEKAQKPEEAAGGALAVYVHVYDVSEEESIQKLNKWLASRHSPLKFGGVFHAGVEVNGLEWSFGMSQSDTMPGISCCEPRTHPAHHYRQTCQLRNTRCNAEEISDLLHRLIEEYPGDDYDFLRRNCCHFADDFCRRLGAGGIPGWIHRLARVGAFADGAMQAITGRKLIDLGMEQDSDDSV